MVGPWSATVVSALLQNLSGKYEAIMIQEDTSSGHFVAAHPFLIPQISASIIMHCWRSMRNIATARSPFEQAVKDLPFPPKKPPINNVVKPAPKGDLLKGNGSDLWIITQNFQNGVNVLGVIELVDVNLPEIIPRSSLGIRLGLLVLLAPEPLPDHNLNLAFLILFGLETSKCLQCAIGRVSVACRERCRSPASALNDDDLMGKRI
jgi:hypothetical protein